ncbi:hypothetical protein ACIQYF_00475 [Pseudomonas sp. NPDC096917]|uniref:hypothetical protein n=1 Tax=Pseudomonas sp. NPDC096917 TaxID=3364483 RepID=UPI00383AF1F8
MSMPAAGTSKKNLFSQVDYLAPLPIPTGEAPTDILNNIWRKNSVYMDVGSYAIGSAVMVLWPGILLFLGMAYYFYETLPNLSFYISIGGGVIVGIPVLMLIQALFQPTPLPARFNRQRREVCIPVSATDYWIVPWETVIAKATEQQSISQAGRHTSGILEVTFENPDPHALSSLKFCTFCFACGGGKPAMAVWECMRSYMEIGPEAVADETARFNRPQGVLATYKKVIVDAANKRGWFLAILWEGFFGIFIFNMLLVEVLERLKLNPPPDLTYPDIIEWSKPLPPEQWAKRSPELELAIAQREAELAARAA